MIVLATVRKILLINPSLTNCRNFLDWKKCIGYFLNSTQTLYVHLPVGLCLRGNRDLLTPQFHSFWWLWFPLSHIVSVVTNPLHSAALPATAQRHQWGPCDIDGQHRFHRSGSHDGSEGVAGMWLSTSFIPQCTNKQYTPWMAVQSTQCCVFSGNKLIRCHNSVWKWYICWMWVYMYIQDHDVQEDKIMLVSLLMEELGVHSVAYAFPRLKIITTAVDKNLDDLLHIIPGIGEFSWHR